MDHVPLTVEGEKCSVAGHEKNHSLIKLGMDCIIHPFIVMSLFSGQTAWAANVRTVFHVSAMCLVGMVGCGMVSNDHGSPLCPSSRFQCRSNVSVDNGLFQLVSFVVYGLPSTG